MSVNYTCDRCGAEVDEPQWFVALKSACLSERWKMLCGNCAMSFDEWMGNHKENDDG